MSKSMNTLIGKTITEARIMQKAGTDEVFLRLVFTDCTSFVLVAGSSLRLEDYVHGLVVDKRQRD